MAAPLLFSGFARIYVEGKGALSPFRWSDISEVVYFIGSPSSKYKIIDQRTGVNQMALNAINHEGKNWSPKVFCTPCFVEIAKDQDGLTILFKDQDGLAVDSRIVWMGTMEGEELLANPVLWLQYRDIEDDRAAFIGVIDPTLLADSEEEPV